MIGLLVVTHGRLAAELVDAARRIVPHESPMVGISIEWDKDVDDARREIEQGLTSLDGGDGVIIATDMFGGTPTNLALTFLEPGRVEVVTGVNLPMVVKFTNLPRDLPLDEAARRMAERGRTAISVAGQILAGRGQDAS
ncbi:MAG: PTS fructose transporter subunit IIA [Acidobacteria bacterium]|nr:MAG: PTS fructose transporter subunit IIA [Acidobacteriota bacterium]